jgi:hypothetical protein
MTEPDAAADAEFLRELADALDRSSADSGALPASGQDYADIADRLRGIAHHLQRIASGGDRPAPGGLTPESTPYEPEPPS